jgi:hypothetical protein
VKREMKSTVFVILTVAATLASAQTPEHAVIRDKDRIVDARRAIDAARAGTPPPRARTIRMAAV